MARIELLDQNTINKIAAGEVVERPGSVVKELVENAIDAGATAITVSVKEGGLKQIRITDNGTGINKNQIKTAFLRHSTSKIRQATDLITIDSLGFRGEALASIASVSMVELITKEANEMTGIRYVIEGGHDKVHEDIGCPTGTTFVINDLFFNTPARLKFMKTPSTELGYIADLMSRLAMGHPTISFKFISNNKVKLQTSGKDDLKDCIYNVFGKDVAKNLIPITGKEEGFNIQGFIGKPHISRGNRTYENYYINGRYIKSKVVERAVEDAFKAKLMLHRYPFVAFHMVIDPKDVDVNVHPTKMEVRFMNEKEVYQCIFDTIDRALNQGRMIPEVKIEEEKQVKMVYKPTLEPFEHPTIAPIQGQVKENAETYKTPSQMVGKIDLMQPTAQKALKDVLEKQHLHDQVQSSTQSQGLPNNGSNIGQSRPHDTVERPESVPGNSKEFIRTMASSKPEVVQSNDLQKQKYQGDQIGLIGSEFIDAKTVKSHKVIGQLFDTYWIVELDEKYYIIDQHAAHEKVLYEQMIKKIEMKVGFGQRLLKAVVVQMTLQEMARFQEHKQLFDDLGFEVETFGEDAVIVRSVPFIFNKIFDVSQFILILDGLEGSYSEDKYSVLLDDIASMSCKAAVKGNDRLSQREYIQLIDDLLTLDNPFQCPHGRPTIIAMTRYELEKKFKRIV